MSVTIHSKPDAVSAFALSEEELAQLDQQGYLGPYRLFESHEAENVLKGIMQYPSSMLPWIKGGHSVIREMYDTGVKASIVEKVKSILGPNILLWGSQLIHQKPNTKHRWHLDVEHGEWEGVTIWLAMKNVMKGSGLSIITGTHHLDVTPQELEVTQNLNLDDDEAVLAAAQRILPTCNLIHLDMQDGEFIIFSGKLWHASQNLREKLRSALIFQYTQPESKVKIAKTYDYPHVTWAAAQPPCVLVHGEDTYKYNKLVNTRMVGSKWHWVNGVFINFPRKCMERAMAVLTKKIAGSKKHTHHSAGEKWAPV